jgi:hypothetical protein
VAVDSNDAVFIADFYNHRVVKWERDTSNGILWARRQCGADEHRANFVMLVFLHLTRTVKHSLLSIVPFMASF